MDAISSVALQSRVPIGIVIGVEQDKLCRTPVTLDLRNITARDALTKIAAASGYSLRDDGGVLILEAQDLTPWQESALHYRFEGYDGDPKVTMSVMATRLTGWIRMEIGNVTSFAGHTSYSPDSQFISVPRLRNPSTEGVANQIVTLGDKGVWILGSSTEKPSGPADLTLTIYSYHDDEDSIRHLQCRLQ